MVHQYPNDDHHHRHRHHHYLCNVEINHLLFDLVNEVVPKSGAVIGNTQFWFWTLGVDNYDDDDGGDHNGEDDSDGDDDDAMSTLLRMMEKGSPTPPQVQWRTKGRDSFCLFNDQTRGGSF